MGLFATKKAVEDLSVRVATVAAEIKDLKTARKHLELEWEELYDKVRHQMARMSRRASREDKTNGDIPPIAGEEPSDDELDPISAKIHARRSRGFLTQ